MNKYIFVISCLLSSFFSFGIDTLIFIPLGETQLDVSQNSTKVKHFACGAFHAYGITESNKNLTFKDSTALGFTPPELNIPLVMLASGDVHAIGLLPDKSIIQFFATPFLDMYYPSKLKNIKEIGAGPNMSFALNEKQMMYVWGAGNVVDKNKIYPITYGVATGSVGVNHTAFINIKNRVFVWGEHSKGQGNIPQFASTPVQIVSGDNHVLVLDASGNVYAWGDTTLGQCAIPDSIGKGKQVYAKGNLSAIETKHKFLYVFGAGINEKIDLSVFNKVHTIGLGNDYLILSVDYTPKKNKKEEGLLTNNQGFKVNTNYKPQPKKDFVSSPNSLKVLEKIANSNFNQNSLKVISSHSTVNNNSNSTQDILFEGQGNNVKVISEGVTYDLNNSHQRVIFKGNNNNVVIKQRGGSVSGSNDTSIVVIDLDTYAQKHGDALDNYIGLSENDYKIAIQKEFESNAKTRVYNADEVSYALVDDYEVDAPMDDLEDKYTGDEYKEEDWSEVVEMEDKDWDEEEDDGLVYDPETAMGESLLGFYEGDGNTIVYSFTYHNDQGQFTSSSDVDTLIKYLPFMPDGFSKARHYLYFGKEREAVLTLKEIGDLNGGLADADCIRELYYIYKKGLYGEIASEEKVQHYLNKYCDYYGCRVYKE